MRVCQTEGKDSRFVNTGGNLYGSGFFLKVLLKVINSRVDTEVPNGGKKLKKKPQECIPYSVLRVVTSNLIESLAFADPLLIANVAINYLPKASVLKKSILSCPLCT